jgi:hypothetical protein
MRRVGGGRWRGGEKDLKEGATEELRDDVSIWRRRDSIENCDVGMSELGERINFTEKSIPLCVCGGGGGVRGDGLG